MSLGYTVGEEAISSMETTSANLQEAQEKMKQTVTQLKSTFEENQNGLGQHISSISALLDELEALTSKGDAKVLKLVLKLTKAIAIRKAHEEDRYKSGGKSK